ncbi:hypothetical protein SZN_14823 [Streptomyces zinciresistens K42]|uniref:SH3b domain-containing protein n=1 Tax=Streptomyces zinciresistens K42 TaxID=700597 RepID=G2GBS7_9ACTN|nr:SH3 domain-containing protein [Streptomyces zinciresistens]EGX59031.1 hypothetical protein SZN_14823 [Streptomyces zinciresistens K42]
MKRRMPITLVTAAALAALAAPSAAVAADGGTAAVPRRAAATDPHKVSDCKAPSSSGKRTPAKRTPAKHTPATHTPAKHSPTKKVAHIPARITSRAALNVRSGPGTAYKVIAHKRAGTSLDVSRAVNGSSVRGNKQWYKLSDSAGYVSARYVAATKPVPWR